MKMMNQLYRIAGSHAVLLTLVVGTLSMACQTKEPPAKQTEEPATAQPELESLLGQPLYALDDTRDGISQADAFLVEDPENLALIVQAAVVREQMWRYLEAIELYGRGIEVAPDDWRLYRHRGHRYITTRQFAEAIPDLEKARELAPYSFDVAFYLGLALYLEGRFGDAADEWGRCLGLAEDEEALALDLSGSFGPSFRSCMDISRDRSTRIVITEWAYRSLRKADRDTAASELLDTIGGDWTFGDRQPYYDLIKFRKGLLSEEQVLDPENLGENRFETLAYGVATEHLFKGDLARAKPLLEEIVADPYWPGFGRIAAEVELVRMGSLATEPN